MSGAIRKNLDHHIGRLAWTDELIHAFWDGVGDTHLDDLSFGKLAGPKFLQLIKQHMPDDAAVCDYGAGGGHFAELLLKSGFATGVYEPSPGRSETLRDRLSAYDRFLGVTRPEDGRQFDVVIMAEVIEHVPDQVLGQTLERMKRLIRKGGIVIVTTPNNENINQAQVFCPVCRQTFHPWQHLRTFTHESLGRLLDEYGFARRFVGLVDFSDDATTIDRSRLFSTFLELVRVLDRELLDFEKRLPPGNARNAQSQTAAGSVYATNNLQFDHGLILAETAKLRACTVAQIGAISWPSGEEAVPVALTQLCERFYSRVVLLIGAQYNLAQLEEARIQIQRLKNIFADIVARFRSVDRAISAMGLAARLERQGLRFLRSPASKLYWAARFCWEFLRHPALLAEIITMPSALADHARAIAAIGQFADPSVGERTERALSDCVAVSESTHGIFGEDTARAGGMSGATEAVCVHLNLIAERIEHALGTFSPSRAKSRAELGYDVYLGRGSNILYIGEKM